MKKMLLAALIVQIVALSFAAKVTQQDIDSLIDTRFSFRGWGIASDITLAGNNRYKLTISSLGHEAKVRSEGRYELSGGKLVLHQESCRDDDTGRALSYAENYDLLIISIEKSDDDLYYSQYLVLESPEKKVIFGNLARLPFGIPDTKVPFGTMRSFDNIPVVTMDMRKGVTITNVKIRMKPSTKVKSVRYMESPYGPGSPNESVPSGTWLVVKARTLEKDKVNEWNNYWYLVDVGVHENVWMFGEFVKLEK